MGSNWSGGVKDIICLKIGRGVLTNCWQPFAFY